MIVEAVFSVVIAVFAVFGIYCFIKLFWSNFYSSVPAAVVIEPSDSISELKKKVLSAESLCICGKCGVILLIPECRKNEKKLNEYVESNGYLSFYYKC